MERNEQQVSVQIVAFIIIYISLMQKAKIRLYKQYKAQQVMELKMREQGVMHWSKQKSDRSNEHQQPLMAMSGQGHFRRNTQLNPIIRDEDQAIQEADGLNEGNITGQDQPVDAIREESQEMHVK